MRRCSFHWWQMIGWWVLQACGEAATVPGSTDDTAAGGAPRFALDGTGAESDAGLVDTIGAAQDIQADLGTWIEPDWLALDSHVPDVGSTSDGRDWDGVSEVDIAANDTGGIINDMGGGGPQDVGGGAGDTGPSDTGGGPIDTGPVDTGSTGVPDTTPPVCACGPDQNCVSGQCVSQCQGTPCTDACPGPAPNDCPSPPGGGQIPGAVTPNAYAKLQGIAGGSAHWGDCASQGDEVACHLFVREAALALHLEDPNWGMLSKNPGQWQCTAVECGNISCGYGEDALIYRATDQVVDVVAGAGQPGASVAWQLVGKLASNNWVPPPCSVQPQTKASDTLHPGESLLPGQKRVSTDGRFSLDYQGDGNLVLNYIGVGPLWASGTGGPAGQCVLHPDGNLVIYDAGNNPVWATNTAGNNGATLHVQSDGNTVLYNQGGNPVWSTETCCY